MNSPIWMPRIASISSSTDGSALRSLCFSSANALSCPHLLGVNLLQRRALVEAGALALRGILLRDGEEGRRADLVRHRGDPLEQLLDARPRRHRLAAVEVDQLAGEPVADRAPQVLLEQPVRVVRQRLALVVRPRDARRKRV